MLGNSKCVGVFVWGYISNTTRTFGICKHITHRPRSFCELDSNLNFIFLSLPNAKIITFHSQQCTSYLFPLYHFKAADNYVFNLSWVLFKSGAEVLSWEFFLCFSSDLDCPFLHLLLLLGLLPHFPEENSLVVIMHKKPIYDSFHP